MKKWSGLVFNLRATPQLLYSLSLMRFKMSLCCALEVSLRQGEVLSELICSLLVCYNGRSWQPICLAPPASLENL